MVAMPFTLAIALRASPPQNVAPLADAAVYHVVYLLVSIQKIQIAQCLEYAIRLIEWHAYEYSLEVIGNEKAINSLHVCFASGCQLPREIE